MRKKYEKVNIEIVKFDFENIITTSGDLGLTNGGLSGNAEKESFGSMFSK